VGSGRPLPRRPPRPPLDPALKSALTASAAAGLPTHDVSPLQGRLLELLARLQGARAILEIGTLGGYSTICLAGPAGGRGRLTTLEADPRFAEVALANLARAGLDGAVELRIGRALETLPGLAAEGRGPFDDDAVLRRTIRRIGLLDRTAVFDEDAALHERIETILGSLTARAPSPPWPPREELLARVTAVTPRGGASL
jgi:O-methyltransferase